MINMPHVKLKTILCFYSPGQPNSLLKLKCKSFSRNL